MLVELWTAFLYIGVLKDYEVRSTVFVLSRYLPFSFISAILISIYSSTGEFSTVWYLVYIYLINSLPLSKSFELFDDGSPWSAGEK